MVNSRNKQLYALSALMVMSGLAILALALPGPWKPAQTIRDASAEAAGVEVVDAPIAGAVTVVEPAVPLVSGTVPIASAPPARFGLDELFVLDNLFSSGAFLDPERTTVGDILILNRLFNE